MPTTQNIPVAQQKVGPAGFTSNGFAVPVGLINLYAALASNDWTKGNVAEKIVTWSIDRNIGGVWDLAVGGQVLVGSWNRGVVGNLPVLKCDPSLLAGASQIRLNVACEATISLGGIVTVVTES